jgi:hypothetical protein
MFFTLTQQYPLSNVIYSCGGPSAIKMWSPLPVTTNLDHDNFFLFLFLITENITFYVFREASVSIKICGFYFLEAPGDCTGRCPLNLALNVCSIMTNIPTKNGHIYNFFPSLTYLKLIFTNFY